MGKKGKPVRRPTEEQALRNIIKEATSQGYGHGGDGVYLRMRAQARRGLVVPIRDSKVVTYEDTLTFLSAIDSL